MGPTTAQPHETSPLLTPDAQNGDVRAKQDAMADASPRKHYVFGVIIALLVIVDFAGCMLEAPQTDIFEKIICDKYYASSSSAAAGRDCTVHAVQGELALVNELLRTLNQMPGILLAIPYGILADRIGRRPVLLLSSFGCCVQDVLAKVVCWWPAVFPLRLVWLSPMGRVIGGGDAVASSMIYLMLADVFPQDEMAGCFFKASATILIGDVVGTPLSAALMTRSSWIPYTLSLALSLVGVLVPLYLLPETLHKTTTAPSERQDRAKSRSLGVRVRLWAGELRQAKRHVFADSNVLLLLFAFFAATLGRQSTGFQLQYVRQRFNWTYARASFLIALRGSVNLALLLVILPLVNRALTARRWTARSRDLAITRASAFSLVVGAATIALAPHPLVVALGVSVLALGAGYASTARSLVTTMVEPGSTGALYTALAVTSGAGGLVAGPLLALTFRWGMSLGRAASGVPFLFVAALFSLSFVATQFVRLKDDDGSPEGESLLVPEEATT
ncbi:Major facilitator superfamily [Macrophomina phaseolina MS6]|uniref:Major facilitator superfamily n=2 Tax=Macrophomina phaseolina TaxID=35725 RepID=K2RJV3_MACPH|nr:Major facilitator superfamily [Macrophomina phaseolina MS6]KAH7042840.1 major facilitator superfamily domain-containing protein [Macrophomina phaseolina]